MKYIVYLTTNKINNKIYIGVHETTNPEIFDGYLGCGVNRNYPSSILHPKTPFQYAVKKYGFDAFSRSTIKVFNNIQDALNLEKELVNEEFISREDTYNITLGEEMPPKLNYKGYIWKREQKLESVSSKENNIVKSRKVGQYTQDGDLIKVFNTVREARKEFPNVQKVLKGIVTHCHNYLFKYID